MTVSVQNQSNVGAGTSLNCAITSTGGNTLVLVISAYMTGNVSVHLSSVTDTAGNTWTFSTALSNQNPPAGGSFSAGHNQYGFCAVAYCIGASAVTSVTATLSASAATIQVGVSEFSGLPSGSTAQGGASSSTLVTGATTYTTPSFRTTGVSLAVATIAAFNSWTPASGGWLEIVANTGEVYNTGALAGNVSVILAAGAGGGDVLSSSILALGVPGTPQVVQTVAGSVTTSYGIGTSAFSTSAQSALVLFAGWNYGVAGTFVTTPAISVSDSAGNLWKQVAITQGGSTVAGNTRSGIWMTVNALPVTWVSIGLTGYTTSADWNIAEITGLPQNIALDYSIGVNSFGTGPTLTGVATGSDFGFAVIANGYNPCTITGPAGWTALGTVTAGSGSTGTYMTSYWNSGITAGTATYTGHITGVPGSVSSYSYALCAVTASASPPAQYDVRHPLIVTEAAFGASPGNPSYSVDYTYDSRYIYWKDISTRVIGDGGQGRITASAGRQYELQQEESGEMSVMLDNHDGAFTPTYPGSPFYSNAINSNMSFQLGVSPWTPTTDGATLDQSSGTAFASGLNAFAAYSALVNSGTAGVTGILSELVAVNANYPVGASAWVSLPGGYSPGIQVGINWYNSGNSFLSSSLSALTAAPDTTWTQYSLAPVTPPAHASYAQMAVYQGGTPTAGWTWNVAEAGMVLGAGTLSTGLVTLKTPVRVTAWWEGRQWPIWMGYAERWPQAWPEMPQWGFSKLTATDAISITAAGAMNSALVGEVLIDGPVGYLPCSEQYTNASVGATPQFSFLFGTSPYYAPADANGLIALNKAAGNQVTGTYADGNGQQASTGVAINFFGDSGTGMGATGYQAEVRSQRGPSMIYSDPALLNLLNSAAGYSIEFWFTWGGSATQDVSLLTVYGTPSSYWNTIGSGNGAFLNIAVIGSNLYLNVNNGGNFLAGTVVPSSVPQHVVFTANAVGGVSPQIYLNGQVPPSEGGISVPNVTPIAAIVLGPGRYSYDCNNSVNYSGFNFSAGHLAVYNYMLTPQRILAHYQTGAQGWSGVSAAQRFTQVLTWAQLGLKRGGYLLSGVTGAPEITQIGPAYQLSGSPASDAINSVAQSEGGQYFVARDGTITYLERAISYNQPTQVTFGDNATAAPDVLNSNPGFQFGNITGWTSQNGNISYNGTLFQGVGSMLLAPASGTVAAVAYSPSAKATGGTTYTAGAWLYSPAGGAYSVGAACYSGTALVSTGGSSLILPPASWAFVSGTVTAPAGLGVTGVSAFVSAGSAVLVSYAFVMQQSAEVPYLQPTEFDFDDTYIYNEVTSTQVDGPNQLIVADVRNPSSARQYFRRSSLTFQSDVVSPYDVNDIVTWSAAQFAQPVIHATAVKVNASADPMIVYTPVLGINLGSIVQVYRRPVGGAVISELGIVERIEYDIGPRYFYVSYQLSPYQPANDVLCADTAGFDTPGTTTLGW